MHQAYVFVGSYAAPVISDLPGDSALTTALAPGAVDRSEDCSAARIGARFVALLDQVRLEASAVG